MPLREVVDLTKAIKPGKQSSTYCLFLNVKVTLSLATRTRSQPSCINTHKCTVGKQLQMGLVLAEKILPNMEKRKLNGPEILDQSKAFDTVNQPVMKLNDLTHAV